jgi:hypothetical protein
MRLQTAFLTLLLVLPVLASGALYQVRAGQLQKSEPGITIDVRYPLVSGWGAEIDAAFNEQSEQRARGMMANFEKEARELRAEAPDAPGTSAQSLDLDFQTKHLSDRLLALLLKGSEYTGGAHPNPILYVLLVDPKSGRKVPVGDLFVAGTDHLALLSKLAGEQLKPRLEELNTDAKWITEGTAAEADNFTLIWPGESGLTVLFAPYQVAPYSSGAPEIVIPYSKLQGVLSDRFFDN